MRPAAIGESIRAPGCGITPGHYKANDGGSIPSAPTNKSLNLADIMGSPPTFEGEST
jgi:hypothetical protein